MKRYTINMTVIDEATGEELAALKVPHLTGHDTYELTMLTLAAVIVEPGEPEAPIHKRRIRGQDGKFKRLLRSRKITPPIEPTPAGFTPKDLET